MVWFFKCDESFFEADVGVAANATICLGDVLCVPLNQSEVTLTFPHPSISSGTSPVYCSRQDVHPLQNIYLLEMASVDLCGSRHCHELSSPIKYNVVEYIKVKDVTSA